MFGSIPKTLWGKAIEPDSRNRIPLTTRILIVDGPEGRAIIDCGNGEKWAEKQRDIFSIKPIHSKPVHELVGTVNAVILTHLHFDHAGGVTFLNDEGQLKLSFPGATHFVQRRNWEQANHPGTREKASYLEDTVLPLANAKLTLLEDGSEILPGVTGHISNGHTTGLQWILIRDREETIAYPSDLIPTAHHVPIPWVMGYDLWAERTMEEKGKFLSQASNEEWLIIFEHDQQTVGGRIKRSGDSKYTFEREDLSGLAFDPA